MEKIGQFTLNTSKCAPYNSNLYETSLEDKAIMHMPLNQLIYPYYSSSPDTAYFNETKNNCIDLLDKL